MSFSYGRGTPAIRDLHFMVRAGEIFCLLGPNGAGKTTLLRQVSAELQPSRGRIWICGFDAHEDPLETRRRLGVIPQEAGLFEGLRVAEHLGHFSRIKGIERRRRRAEVDRVLHECDLVQQAGRRIRELSGGQKRKVMIALALLGSPEILLLDEPSVGLDPVARRSLWHTIEREAAKGTTILLTTHYMEEAERLSNRIGFLDRGELARVGTLDDLRRGLDGNVRVDVFDPSYDGRRPLYFDGMEEAQAYVARRGLRHYAVRPISLDDVYLRLVGTPLPGGGT